MSRALGALMVSIRIPALKAGCSLDSGSRRVQQHWTFPPRPHCMIPSMASPDWATIKAADAAYSGMIAAWWSAIVTTIAMSFAAVAVWWARRAALEAATQAKSATESVEWSRKAAEAALAQTLLLQKQLEFSEPQPIVLLTIDYQQSESSRRLPVIELRNVGEEAAFDVETSELRMVLRMPEERVRRFAFEAEPILLTREARRLRRTGVRLVYPNDNEWLLSLFETSREAMSAASAINEELIKSADFELEKFASMATEPMTVRYRNARGKAFEQAFVLRDDVDGVFMFFPAHSLVRADSQRSTD
jgi:hypothetical protein